DPLFEIESRFRANSKKVGRSPRRKPGERPRCWRDACDRFYRFEVYQPSTEFVQTRPPGPANRRIDVRDVGWCPSLRAMPQGLWQTRPFDASAVAMKGVGKFGEVMAGETGKVSYDDVAARLQKIIHSGSQRKAITDFVCRELRKIPHYTWVGIYSVEGPELVLASWSGPSATQHTRIPIGQ